MHIRNTEFSELKSITDIGAQSHAKNYLSNKSLETHEIDFIKNDTIYLSVISKYKLFAGYIILCTKNLSRSVQLKRILIHENYIGIGQQAILATEEYCTKKLNCNHIWLDVYDNNSRAKHIYEKLGYIKYNETIQNNNPVLFYEKRL